MNDGATPPLPLCLYCLMRNSLSTGTAIYERLLDLIRRIFFTLLCHLNFLAFHRDDLLFEYLVVYLYISVDTR
jgi:hypothetical protein